MTQNRSMAVMANRIDAPAAPDFFPTPPWATRALCEHLARRGKRGMDFCWEPACGEGHMVRPLEEYFTWVSASDIHDYGAGYEVRDFLDGGGLFGEAETRETDWIITNPPFNRAADFALRGIGLARVGVALLVRTAFLEGGERYRNLFDLHPPEWILQFSERVPMVKGRLDKKASSATAYCWIIWTHPGPSRPTLEPSLAWVPPGTRKRLERPGDYLDERPNDAR